MSKMSVITVGLMATDSGGRRAYPEGTKVQMTEAWKRLVERRLEEMGKDRAWLADQLEVEKSTITRLLADQNTSSLVPKIVELLEIPSPFAPIESLFEEETLGNLKKLDPDDLDLVRDFIQRLARTKDD